MFFLINQFTEEKLGQAEKTELDAHFENLLQRADKTRDWTDKILKQTEAVLQPNPSKCYTFNCYRSGTYNVQSMQNKEYILRQHPLSDPSCVFGVLL